MTARVSERAVATLAATMSRRDRAVVSDLARVRLLTARQIERLHFRNGSALTQARRARRTLERLTSVDVLHRFERRIGGARAGSAGYVYGLGSVGQRLVESARNGKRARRPWEPSASFIDHVLAVSELYVELREGERSGVLELLAFDAEPASWRGRPDLGAPAVKPDAFVAVGVDDFEESRFVEVDLGTESTRVIRRKADAYLRYWRSGEEQAALGVFPQVLFLTNTTKRADAIAAVVASERDPPLFRVTLLDQAVEAITSEETPSADDN